MSSRKAPRCRSCKHPMKGHNKLGLCMSASPEVLSKEEEEAEQQQQAQGGGAPGSSRVSAHSYMSPPPTPPPSSTYAASSESQATGGGIAGAISPLVPNAHAQQQQQPQRPIHIPRTYTPAIMSEPSFIIPETGYFHRRNPNFVHPPPRQVLPDPYNNNGGGAYGTPAADHDDEEEEDEDYNGGPGAQTPTVIVGSDGETVEALSDRSGSVSPRPPGTRARTPRANQYVDSSTSSSSSFFGAVHNKARYGYGAARTDAEERCERVARHSRSPRPPKAQQQRNGSVIAGGLAYLGSFNWIRSPTPSDASAAYISTGAAANTRHRSSRLGHRRPHHLQPHQQHQAVAPNTGETKISTRDMMVLGLVVVVGSAVSMMLVMYVGLRSLRSLL